MNTKAYLALLFCVLLCPFLAFAQQIVGTEASNVKSKGGDRYFSFELKRFTKPTYERDSGGESGGGGEWLESELAATIFQIVEGLKTNNPHNLNIKEFSDLVEKTQIIQSENSNDFFLNHKTGRRDAINYFPKKLILKLYSPKWAEYYRNGADVRRLLYHEYLPYFFGNDEEYVRSREIDFKKPTEPLFKNMVKAIYASEYDTQSNCLVELDFNQALKTVSLYWRSNTSNARACGSSPGPLVFQCSNNFVNECFYKTTEIQLDLTMSDPETMSLTGKFLNSDKIESHDIFKRLNSNGVGLRITEFSALRTVYNQEVEYTQICRKAFDLALKDATERCQLASKKRCNLRDSEVVRVTDTVRGDRCTMRVHVTSK